MGTINAQDPNSHVTSAFADLQSFANALQAGYIPVRPDGSPYVMQQFQGGIILDGAPLDVYFNDEWYTGQKELIMPHWGKDVPAPSPTIQALPEVPMPADVAAQYNAYVSSQSGIPTPLLIIGGILAWSLLG